MSPATRPVRHPALCAVDLAVRYGEVTALRGVSFEVEHGEMVAVVGPNGSGKSTLFKALAGFVDHDGDVVLNGRRCHHLERRSIAYIPQQLAVDLRFPITVGEVVLAGRRGFHGRRFRPTGHDRDVVAASLATVDLADHADRSLSTLSGGQVQRVLLARALAQEPEVLLLDETLATVDEGHVADLLEVFSELCGAGRAVLVTVHDLSLVKSSFSRVIALNGDVVGDGPPRRVLSPRNLEMLYTARTGR